MEGCLGDRDSIALGSKCDMGWRIANVVKGDIQGLRCSRDDIAQIESRGLPGEDWRRHRELDFDRPFTSAIGEKEGGEFVSKKSGLDFQFDFGNAIRRKHNAVASFQGQGGLNREGKRGVGFV